MRRGRQKLTPGRRGGVGVCQNYVSGGGNIGYVMELAEHGGTATHGTLEGAAPLEVAHYLHLVERGKNAPNTEHMTHVTQTWRLHSVALQGGCGEVGGKKSTKHELR